MAKKKEVKEKSIEVTEEDIAKVAKNYSQEQLINAFKTLGYEI